LDFVSTSLRVLSLDSLTFNDSLFKQLLEKINESKCLKELSLIRIPLDTDYKLGLFNGFLAGNK
jgi:hypothetical protein